MFGIAQATTDRNWWNRRASCQVASPAQRAVQMNTPSEFRIRVVSSAAVALFCLAPLVAFAKIPGESRGSRTIQESIQASSSNESPARGVQAGGQQDSNLPPAT